LERYKALWIPAWYPTPYDPTYGIFIKEHARACSLFHDITIIYAHFADFSPKKIIEFSVEEGIPTYRIYNPRSPLPKTNTLLRYINILRLVRKLRREGYMPDIVHVHCSQEVGLIGVILNRLLKLPLVITEHSSVFPRRSLSSWDRKMVVFSLNRCDIILPVSKFLEESIKSYGVKNRFAIIPNAVDTSLFYPSHKPYDEEKKRMLIVARLIPCKGIPFLLEALHILKKHRRDFSLDIVGDGPNREEYEEMVKVFSLRDFVHFHGVKPKEYIAELMRESFFFVLPSFSENLPCVLIEAMASGLPCVATNVGGIPELVNKERGILVEPGNSTALAEAIDYMLDHYKDYNSSEISDYAKNNFSYEAVGEKISRVYEDLLSRRKK